MSPTTADTFRSYFCEGLTDAARTYVMRNFTDVAASSDELMDLSCDDLVNILGSDDLNARHEENVKHK
jgi:hypothetical protein